MGRAEELVLAGTVVIDGTIVGLLDPATLVDGELVLYLERGGKSALVFSADDEAVTAATADLAATARTRHLDTLTVEQVNGDPIFGTAFARALREAGFVETPRGLTLRKASGSPHA